MATYARRHFPFRELLNSAGVSRAKNTHQDPPGIAQLWMRSGWQGDAKDVGGLVYGSHRLKTQQEQRSAEVHTPSPIGRPKTGSRVQRV